MNASKKRYDLKHKLTRILLGDYLVLKRISQAAGVSMAEALHQLIEHQAQLPLPEPKPRPEPEPVAVATKPAFRVESTPVTRARSTPITISFSREVGNVNGHRQAD